MPNFPNYYLGAETGSVCDSLTSSISDLKNLYGDVSLFPNPASSVLILKSTTSKIISLTIYNSLGQNVEEVLVKNKADQLQLNIDKLETGFYFLEVMTEKGNFLKKFIKE